MSAVGSPGTATRSASRPGLIVPMRSAMPQHLRVDGGRGQQRLRGRHPVADHPLGLAVVLAVREDADVAAAGR